MDLEYLSHPNKRLSEHIGNIIAFDSDKLFVISAKFHDIGKVCDRFQCYINQECSSSEPHSWVSGLLFLINQNSLNLKQKLFVFNTIVSHHTSLSSLKKLSNRLIDDTSKEYILSKKQIKEILNKQDVCKYFNITSGDISIAEDFGFDIEDIEFCVDDYIIQKLLYSKLIFADKYEAITSQPFMAKEFDYSSNSIDRYKKSYLKYDKSRDDIAKDIFKNYNNNQKANIYTLTAPTGIGKTLISLELALQIANQENKKRVIYTIPFTSIIDQTVNIFEDIFPNKITKHHYKVEFKSEDEHNNSYDRVKYIVESWSNPFIVSTFYQLFFALFSNNNSNNIKFQSLKESVIVLDEVQSIPFELWKVMQELFEKLAKRLDSVFILMSATMPIVTKDAIELTDTTKLFTTKNRYKIKYLNIDKNKEALEYLSQKIVDIVHNNTQTPSILCVVNTIKNSKVLYHLLKEKIEEDKIYLLNSYILPKDREQIIQTLCESNSNLVKNKILISTQVIEAGVDLDFDIGFRELSPLSSIIQTAGRVNREGKKEQADIFVFDTIDVQIYDSILVSTTKEYLLKNIQNSNCINEKDILYYIENFFKELDIRLSDRKEILNSIKKFDFTKIDKSINDIFKTELDYTNSVLLGIDLKKEEQKYFEKAKIYNRWELKSYKERCLKSYAPYIINVKNKNLEELNINVQKSDIFGLYYIDCLEGVYDSKIGFITIEDQNSISIFE